MFKAFYETSLKKGRKYITEEEFASLSQQHEENLYTMAPEDQSFEEKREVSDSLSSTVSEK